MADPLYSARISELHGPQVESCFFLHCGSSRICYEIALLDPFTVSNLKWIPSSVCWGTFESQKYGVNLISYIAIEVMLMRTKETLMVLKKPHITSTACTLSQAVLLNDFNSWKQVRYWRTSTAHFTSLLTDCYNWRSGACGWSWW